jgi:DNA-binding CsgD family transcriptional regulator
MLTTSTLQRPYVHPTRPAARVPPDPVERTSTLLAQLEIVLDRMADGMVVVDSRARIVHANRRAREILASTSARRPIAGALSFADVRTQDALERALASLRDETHDPDAEHCRRTFLVRDAAGTTVARAAVEPLQRRTAEATAPDRFLVTLHQLPHEARFSVDALRSLYGLTPSEARVAAHVVGAASLTQLAERLALSRNTVKTHLRRTFRKCEVKSLAQLTALIATGPGVR